VNAKMVLVHVTVLVILNLVIAVAGNGMHVVEGILVPLLPLSPLPDGFSIFVALSVSLYQNHSWSMTCGSL